MIYFLAIYLILQILLGVFISRFVKNADDFFVAGRSMPFLLVSLSLTATWFGAETCIGTSAAVYKGGLSGSRADPFGYSICLLLMGLFFAAPLWRGGYITLADLFKDKFGSTTEKIAALVMVPGSIMWAAAQTRAFSQILESLTQMPGTYTLIICTAILVLYTFLGGLLGDIITDSLQGTLLFIGLIVILYASTSDVSSEQIMNALTPERLSLLKTNEGWLQRIEHWSIPILGSIVAQELLSRVFSAKSQSIARNASFFAAFLYLFLGCIPVFLGLIGPLLLDDVGSNHEQFLPLLAQKYLSPFMFIIFIGALVSAILSTIDSIYLSISAIVANNLLGSWYSSKKESHQLLIARCIVILAALLSFTFALYSTGIYELLELASALGASGILVATLIALNTKFHDSYAATSCIMGGSLFHIIFEQLFESKTPFISAILASFITYVVIFLLRSQKLKTSS